MIAANLGDGAMFWRKSILPWIVILAVAILCRLFLPRDNGFTLYLKGSTHYLGLNIVISWGADYGAVYLGSSVRNPAF
jgi:hypothetical protein